MMKGLGGLGDMSKMMKAAKEMQDRMQKMQDDLASVTVTGESGAGLVRATATARGELTALEIDPSIFQPSEKEVVEDLILAAIKDAQVKASERSSQEMQKITEERGAGVYLDIDQAGDLAKRIKPDRAERRMRRENQPTEYWNSPFLFMFFLVAVSSEWWIRRRNRLV